jgi:hypothetical protein
MHQQANAALSNSKCMRLQHAITHLEQQVHQALAVMDRDSGKLLNYKQLTKHPKYKKQWSTSSANEFGWLAQGVGGRIKHPTNTIHFIQEDQVP